MSTISFLSFTVFDDLACTTVRSVANLYGRDAERALCGFRTAKAKSGGQVKEGDVIYACRIDCIGEVGDPSHLSQDRKVTT